MPKYYDFAICYPKCSQDFPGSYIFDKTILSKRAEKLNYTKDLRALSRVFGLLESQNLKVTSQHLLWNVLLDE